MSRSYQPYRFKREYIPVIIALLILGLLIAALVYTITYKPKTKDQYYEENSVATDEVIVDTSNTVCTEEVNNKIKEDANNVKIKYEVVSDYYFGKADELDTDLNGDGEFGEIDIYGPALRISIEGITDNVYVKLENDLDYQVQTYKASDAQDGIVKFDQTENAYIRTYDVKVYSANTECGEVLFREFTFKLPRLNELRQTNACSEYPDMKMCSSFVWEQDEPTLRNAITKEYKEFKREAEEKKQQEEQEQNKSIFEKIKDNKVLMIAIVACVVVVIGVVVIVIKRRRK